MTIEYLDSKRFSGLSDGVSNGYDVANISYSGKSSSSSSQNTYMLGIGFNADGTKMYRTGYSSTRAIFQYTLSTAWDISTASYDSVSFSLPSPIAVPYGIEWNGDGTKFVVGDTSTGDLYQFSLTTAYDISTTNSTPTTYDSSQATKPVAIKFTNSGTKVFVLDNQTDTVFRYSLSTAYDITTMSYDSNSFTTANYYLTGLELNSDGTEMYLQDHVGNSLRRFTLSTAYDLSTASLTSSFSTSSQFSANTTSALRFSADGTKLYISGYGASDQQYSTGSAEARTWTRGYFPITRGVIAGGEQSPVSDVMDYITIATTGDALDFGDLTQARYGIASMYSDTRGVFACGYNGGYFNIIDYITILTAGNATDFGDASTATYSQAGVSNKTRGVFASNGASRGSNLDYITIATTGNATSGFGSLTRSTTSIGGNVNSETRGVFLAGNTSGDVYSNVMDYITIDTTGNAIDFGDLTVGRYSPAGLSSETRGVISGGNISGSTTNNIDYITIDTTGNATDFGDLSSIRSGMTGGLTNDTRGVMAGGSNSGGRTNVIEYITIDTTGNATDFGDLTLARSGAGGVSG